MTTNNSFLSSADVKYPDNVCEAGSSPPLLHPVEGLFSVVVNGK